MKVLIVNDGKHTCTGIADNGEEAGAGWLVLMPADTSWHTTTPPTSHPQVPTQPAIPQNKQWHRAIVRVQPVRLRPHM